MVEKIDAKASPEKRLFISLITRDISLVDAILDIVDNSINAALEPLASQLTTADHYQRLLSDANVQPKVIVDIKFDKKSIVVSDTAPGISTQMAQEQVFKFGRDKVHADDSDRLSVYGLGLKRAMFKCGNKVEIVSDHRKGGFALDLNVRKWETLTAMPWTFEITPRDPTTTHCGTRITLSELHEEVVRRIDDGLFLAQLREKVARTYSFFIGRIVNIMVNGIEVVREPFEIGDNYSSEKFKSGNVSCNITAGIAVATGEHFRDKNAGWFVFCNGRTVLYADKSSLTGWNSGGLPIFQPKHRPFLGTVFFVSVDPEALPWTTTKASVNEESVVWQMAKLHMANVGRVITGFLDKRYSGEGLEIAPSALKDTSGSRVDVLAAAVGKAQSFKPPLAPSSETTKIQYNAKVADVKRIEAYLRRPGMGGSEVGRHTFNYFLKNEVKGAE